MEDMKIPTDKIKVISDKALNLLITEHLETVPKPPESNLTVWSDRQQWNWHLSEWRPAHDYVNDGRTVLYLLYLMKRDDMQFVIESEPDYDDADFEKFADAIDAHRDYEIRVLRGDSNCYHQKPYNPVDGHGFTEVKVVAGSFGRAVAEAFALAHQLV